MELDMMDAFFAPLKELKSFEQLQKHIEKGNGVVLATGCIDSQKAQLVGALQRPECAQLVITADEQKARQMLEECRFYMPQAVYFPARDILFYQSDVRGNALTRDRMLAYQALREQEAPVIVTTIDAVMERLIRPEVLYDAILTISCEQELDMEQVRKQLVNMGYEYNYQAEQPGQFAVRGGILDIFPLTEQSPYRVELFGDEVDSIRRFDAESQRSMETLEEVCIYPVSELVLDETVISDGVERIQKDCQTLYETYRQQRKTQEAHRLKENCEYLIEQLTQTESILGAETYLSYFYKDTRGLLDYMEKKSGVTVYVDEPQRCLERARVVEQEFSEGMSQRLEKGYILPGQLEVLQPLGQIVERLNRLSAVLLSTLESRPAGLDIQEVCHFCTRSVSTYNGSFETLIGDLKKYHTQGYRLILLSGSRTRAARFAQDLQDEGLPVFLGEDPSRVLCDGELMVLNGTLKSGYEYPELRFAVLTENDIFGQKRKQKKKKKRYEGERINSFSELKVGDYVVHENHGLGIYRGIEKIEVNKTIKDYIKIEYDKGGNLYVLATQLDLIQKYAGSDAKKPKLNRLGGQDWVRTRSKVQGAVKEIAQELVDLYAARQNTAGYVYGPDTVWQREFEEMFPYEETDDQLAAIEATKQDMESTKIMDRLICGDVGFGKTEVAIRAAFKAVQEGKQVAYLVPTTILAQQHYNTFAQRMKDFPVQVDLMCRFRTSKQQKQTIEDLKKGMCDIVIGTHRLLSKDVEFKNLGLLIVDEEQRFGVTHKEKIKQMKKDVDVLTLTATPIPRTLHMSLVGIRDMSVLEEAPMDRMPIQTYVMEYDEEMVREAIKRELSRGGQVYYVFNRVNQIADMTAKISELVPEASVAYAHGQMRERELEDIMYQFINGEIDVLVSTTIIETGLDISNANTMIVHDADNMGLSQLYQLRGRIGRSNRTSYAFLMYRRNKMLREVAEKRLSAIREFSELGSGFKIAMKDLEIRGAGNLLGAQQHGHMEAVGYDLYCKMLNQAVKTVKGEREESDDFETVLELDLDAYIPASYIPNENQKLDIYKRIACIENEEESSEMMDELIDRFGDPPKSVENLLLIAQLKALAHKVYLTEVSEKSSEIRFQLYEKAKVDAAKIPEIVELFRPYLNFRVDSKAPGFYYRKRKGGPDTLTVVKNFLTLMEQKLLLT